MWVYRQIGSIRISIELLAGASPYRLLVEGARLRLTACPHANKVSLDRISSQTRRSTPRLIAARLLHPGRSLDRLTNSVDVVMAAARGSLGC